MQRMWEKYHQSTLTVLWLTWMLVAATKRMIRMFPAPGAELNTDAFWTYLPNARNLLKGPWHFLTQVEDSLYVAPLTYIWPALWGSDVVRVQLANCALFLFSILLMWRLSTRLGGLLAGMISTALLVFHPEITSFIPQVLTESMYLFSILLFLTSIAEYALTTSHQRRWLALASLGLAMTLLSRPVLQIFTLATLVFVLVGLWFRTKKKSSSSQGWGLIINGGVAIALIGALALPMATVIKNGVYFQYWGLSTGAGSGLYYGVSPFKMGIEPVYGGYDYDASVVPKTADPKSMGHPLRPLGDGILSRVAVSVIKNTSLEDNARFFYFKLKAWLFFGEEELRMNPGIRTLRTFEWLSILLALSVVTIRAIRRPHAPQTRAQACAGLLPNADGFGLRRLTVYFMLLLLTLAMALQLTPVLYNIRYNLFFLEPMLMALCGISVGMLLRTSDQRKSTTPQATGWSRVAGGIAWATPRILVIALLAYIPGALTKHAKRHRAWAMDPYRPGPTKEVLGPSQMQPPSATNAEASGVDQWVTTQRPAVLTIPFELSQSVDHKVFMDGIWRLKLAVNPPHDDRNCKNVRMELTSPSPEQLWYTPEPIIHVKNDGKMHMYAVRGNSELRPASSGAIRLIFNCPAGTHVTWGHAQLLQVDIQQAARALIQDGVPINPYRPDDIK